MNEKEEKGSSFKVNDRRRFDSEGNEKGSVGSDQPKKPASAGAVSGEGFIAKPAQSLEGQGVITFTSFVMSLATQALMQIGHLQPPPGVEMKKDVEAARQTIYILGMLELKTKGNLDPEEARLLQDILHSVRLIFVKG